MMNCLFHYVVSLYFEQVLRVRASLNAFFWLYDYEHHLLHVY